MRVGRVVLSVCMYFGTFGALALLWRGPYGHNWPFVCVAVWLAFVAGLIAPTP